MPKTTVNADLYCDGALVTSGDWTGVSLNYLLNETQATSDISTIQFTASDGYKVNIPYEVALHPETIIAYEKDGEPLIEELRLILPGSNGAAWIAMITSITMNTAAANYNEGVSVGAGKILQMIPTPETPTQLPTTETQIPTPTNSSNSQVTQPANITAQDQPTSPSQVSKNTETPLEESVLTVVVVLIVILVIAGYMAYRRKTSVDIPQSPIS
jgi:hypothetical protein